MPTAGKIETFHRNLITKVMDVIGWEINISPSCPEWKAVKPTAKIRWSAFPEGTTPVERAYRDQGDRVYVFSVKACADETDPRGWVTWSEKWVKNIKREFELLSAGWTAFWGSPYDDQKVPVLRADWDQPDPDRTQRQQSEAGQPHWHVDRVIPVQDGGIGGQAVQRLEGEIEPVVSEDRLSLSRTVPALSMGKVHLSMGTWESDAHPKCWQRSYDGDCDKLLDWAGKTLQYLQGQLGSKRNLVHLEDVPAPS